MMRAIKGTDGGRGMDATDLSIFAAVAHSGSMSRAAETLYTVQSNVTARIQSLERELGVPLFHRHSRGVTLTSAGQVLLPYAAEVSRLLAEAARAASDTGVPRGPLRIGSLETTAARRLPPILAHYAAAYPAVDLSLHTGTTAELVVAVTERQLDGALVAGPVSHPALVELPLLVEELVLVTSPACRSVDEALRRAEGAKLLVLRAGCSYRQRLEYILADCGITNARVLEFGTLDAIIGCAAAGIGITLLPRSVVERAHHAEQITVHTLPTDHSLVTTVFIRRQDAFVSAALKCFIEACRQYLSEASILAASQHQPPEGQS